VLCARAPSLIWVLGPGGPGDMMVDGVLPLGGGAATRSMEAGQSELVAAGAMRESAAADRLMWGLVAHEGHRLAVR
jgi:ABC-type uncharacterized transport system permease subunit